MISRRLLRIKVIKALYAHIAGQAEGVSGSQKTLNFAIAKSYELYFMMLQLPVEVARYGARITDEGKNKLQPTFEEKNPNMRFIESPVIAQLSQSKAINEFLEKSSLSWNKNPELIKYLYQSIKEKSYYKEYMAQKKCSYERHREFLKDFYLNEIEDCEQLRTALDEISLWWCDDIEYAASHAMKTVSLMTSEDVTGQNYKEINLLPMYRDSSDAQFAKDLFIKAASSKESSLEYIDKFTRNWDLERIALMDKIVMIAALTEIKEFASIPVTVSMDEYIEISKYYSTPTSSNFINGVLDKMVADLKESGVIKK